MSQLTLIVPGLAQFNPEHNEALPELEHLNTVVSNSKQSLHEQTYFQSLFSAMGLEANSQQSIAALSAKADGLNFEDPHCLRIDPVELRADLAAIYMYGNHHFSVSESQCEQVKRLIQPLLSEYGMTLHTSLTKRWYLSCSEQPKLSAFEPNSVIGKDILSYLPVGTEPINWKRLQTEIQMALHEIEGIAPINSLWIWGEGTNSLERSNAKMTSKSKILFADETIARGLAEHLGVCFKALQDFDATQLSCDNETDIIVVYEKFQLLDNHTDYLKQLIDFEQHELQLLLKSLQQKAIDRIILHPINGVQYELKRRRFRHFWKRTKNLKEELCKRPS